MRRSSGIGLAVAVIGAALLSGCGGAGGPASELPDGTYEGTSPAEEDGTYGIVSFTVTGGTLSDVAFTAYDEDGTPHDEDYGLKADGTAADKDFYQRAQNAIVAEQKYVAEFEEEGDQNEVETIAGASLSYRLFQGAVEDAIANS
ncbi:MAG: FMN-binding protein [Ancrocorticia sp.]|uniref:FMN-binding protein n=1 Tax=Ancrocorticia sp. TaxID=2593684 RepID=UPI003F8F547C